MEIEIRADGVHISGYVNVPGRESRPVITPRGKVIEVIEQRAFQRAIEKADNIIMLLDHDRNRVLASTKEKTLEAHEDEIGLRAEAVVTDPETVADAKAGKIKGWSFNMRKVKDQIEERANGLPLRIVKDFEMDEITLVMNKWPVYSATSVEIRAGEEDEVEQRAIDQEITVRELSEKQKQTYDNGAYQKRIEALKRGKAD